MALIRAGEKNQYHLSLRYLASRAGQTICPAPGLTAALTPSTVHRP